ncbi:MAG TPA: tetratricopeptide repeat protein, partial [Candidatus Bathyarchaeia archaeon]|nr:tetratricopeptide repeat protein [Candidatus Bathyarchaeia archaeon]
REGNNTVLMRLLTLLYSRMGDALICDGKVSEALSNYQQDFNLIQPLVAADPSDVHLRQRLVGALASMGDAQMHLGRFKAGRELMSRAFGELEKLPGNDAQVLSYRAFVLVVTGELLQKSGDIPGALRNYAQALQIYSSFSQADAPDTEDQVNLSEVRDHLGRAYLEAGQAGKASSEYGRACEMSESLLSSHPDNIEILYALGDCYAGLGNVAAASARRAANPTDQARRWSISLGWYSKSLSAWKRIPNPSRIAPNGFEVGGMQQAIRAAEAAANKAVKLRGNNIPRRRKLRDAGVALD